MKFTYSAATVVFLLQVALAAVIYSLFHSYDGVRVTMIILGLMMLILYGHSEEVWSIAFAGIGAGFAGFEVAGIPIGMFSGVSFCIAGICTLAAGFCDQRKQPFLLRLVRNAPLGISILGDLVSIFAFREPSTPKTAKIT